MNRAPVRSTIFNLTFFLGTLVACIALLPTLVLPRPWFMWVVHSWVKFVHLCEKYLLGLDYEIRGAEHLPASGPYIVAAKHQSPYETMKLHMLFGDPAIILKQELLKIPLWGPYLNKSDVIAIDRSSPERARKSIADGAIRVKDQDRPIVIFPQGTRVPPGTDISRRPYKSGIVHIQEATELPIIPLAMNSGMFWLKGHWNKSPGKVVFEFLPPIEPGLEKDELMNALAKQIEPATKTLEEEALKNNKKSSGNKTWIFTSLFIVLLLGAYTKFWFYIADEVKNKYINFSNDLEGVNRIGSEPVVTGFPGPIRIKVGSERFSSPEGSVSLKNIHIWGWPVPDPVVSIRANDVEVTSYKWAAPLPFNQFEGQFQYVHDTLRIKYASLVQEQFIAQFEGLVDFKQKPLPRFDVMVLMENHLDLLQKLAELKIIKEKQAVFMGFGFGALEQDGIVRVDVVQKDRTLYVGPLPVLELPAIEPISSDLRPLSVDRETLQAAPESLPVQDP